MPPKKRLQLGAGIAVIGLAACGGSGTSPAGVTTASVGSNVLQFAAGTANIAGTAGLNVVVTYRQPTGGYKAGDSGALVNSVSLTGPFTLPSSAGTADPFYSTIETGPGGGEVGGNTMGSTPQTGSTASTTFGTSGQASGLGLEPYNYNNGSVPDSVAPYTLPLYDTASDVNAFVPWGGPPAFDPNKDGEGVRDIVTGSGSWPWAVPAGTLGVSEGIDVFRGITPSTTRPYAITVSVPGQTAGTTTAAPQASFTLKSTALLGTLAAAPTPVLGTDTNGNTTVSVSLASLPTGATGAYVQIVDFGPDPALAATTGQPASCNSASAAYPVYYTLYLTGAGTQTITGLEGPRAASGPTPSLCSAAQNTAVNLSSTNAPVPTDGDQFTVQEIGFDYPLYEASYPNSLGNPSPAIVGAAGQDDITISPLAVYTQPNGGALTNIQNHGRLLPNATLRR